MKSREKKINKRQTGQEQENRATVYLTERGYKILERNYRCRMGEIDLIAFHQGYLVFVEVKYRRGNRAGRPEEAVDFRKQKKISQTATWYLKEKGLSLDTPCRFDVVAITPEEIRVFPDAFFYRQR